MKYSNINYCWADLIIEELIRCGAGPFCIAPGSRNTPLALTVASKCPDAVSHFDERGLGFYAMGTAASGGKIPVLICTSGSAVANFFPAVAECSKKKLPMIILSADRPYESKDAGAPQTMKQEGLFGSYTSWDTNLPAPSTDIKPEVVLTTVDYAVFRAKRPIGSPVQINCMFREPLAPADDKEDFTEYMGHLAEWKDRERVYTSYTPSVNRITVPEELSDAVNKAERGVIGVGKLGSEEDRQAVMEFAEKTGWPVFADVTSGLKMSTSSDMVIRNFDQILLSSEFNQKYRADFVIQAGGRITSKRWHEYVDISKPSHYVMALNHFLRNDPFHSVTHRFEAGAGTFFRSLSDSCKLKRRESGFADTVIELDRIVDRVIDDYVTGSELNDIKTASVISESVEDGDSLYLSSSMPIRDMDMYGRNRGRHVAVVSNRGLNGIDGVIASAAGYTAGRSGRTVLLTGDLAALHDLNSLVLVQNKALTIVINNNGGGGIFSFLPASKSGGEAFEKFCAAPHNLSFDKAAEMFGIGYSAPVTGEELVEVLKNSRNSKEPLIIEIKSARDENRQIHSELAGKCRAAVAGYIDNI